MKMILGSKAYNAMHFEPLPDGCRICTQEEIVLDAQDTSLTIESDDGNLLRQYDRADFAYCTVEGNCLRLHNQPLVPKEDSPPPDVHDELDMEARLDAIEVYIINNVFKKLMDELED